MAPTVNLHERIFKMYKTATRKKLKIVTDCTNGHNKGAGATQRVGGYRPAYSAAILNFLKILSMKIRKVTK